jgi:hypothetical protein
VEIRPTLADLSSRSMTMVREPKRWTPKKKAEAKPAEKHEEKKPGAEDRRSKLYTRKKD